jgi:hypothetical protein
MHFGLYCEYQMCIYIMAIIQSDGLMRTLSRHIMQSLTREVLCGISKSNKIVRTASSTIIHISVLAVFSNLINCPLINHLIIPHQRPPPPLCTLSLHPHILVHRRHLPHPLLMRLPLTLTLFAVATFLPAGYALNPPPFSTQTCNSPEQKISAIAAYVGRNMR